MNLSRRNFLKILLFGSGIVALTKLSGGNIFRLFGIGKNETRKNSKIKKIQTANSFENSEITENEKEIAFLDKKSGEKILIIEK